MNGCQNITFVISSLSSGGAERVISLMANYWSDKNYNVTIITFDDGSISPFYDLKKSVKHLPIGVTNNSDNPFRAIINNIGRIFILRHSIKSTTPDVVISFVNTCNILSILANIYTKTPIIVSERSDPIISIPNQWALLRFLTYPLASAVIVQTKNAFSRLPSHLNSRVIIIPNPIVTVEPINHSQTPKNGNKIIAAGRLSHEKGFDLLIDAFSIVSSFHEEWILEIWGEGILRKKLEMLIEQRGIKHRVHLPGKTKHLHQKMLDADIFVLSSRFEGFPNALCEAMATGLPVIATDCLCGPSEIIIHDYNGILVPCKNVDALADAMNKLMTDENYRKRLSKEAVKIIDRFHINKVMCQWEEVLLQITL